MRWTRPDSALRIDAPLAASARRSGVRVTQGHLQLTGGAGRRPAEVNVGNRDRPLPVGGHPIPSLKSVCPAEPVRTPHRTASLITSVTAPQ